MTLRVRQVGTALSGGALRALFPGSLTHRAEGVVEACAAGSYAGGDPPTRTGMPESGAEVSAAPWVSPLSGNVRPYVFMTRRTGRGFFRRLRVAPGRGKVFRAGSECSLRFLFCSAAWKAVRAWGRFSSLPDAKQGGRLESPPHTCRLGSLRYQHESEDPRYPDSKSFP